MKEDRKDKDKALREHVIYLLDGGGAHAKFDEVVAEHSAQTARRETRRPAPLALDAAGTPAHRAMGHSGIQPQRETRLSEMAGRVLAENGSPAQPAAWNASVKKFRQDLKTMQDLVKDPKTDLFARIPWGDGQTILREALLVADHNAYHLGQMLDARRLLGAWPEK